MKVWSPILCLLAFVGCALHLGTTNNVIVSPDTYDAGPSPYLSEAERIDSGISVEEAALIRDMQKNAMCSTLLEKAADHPDDCDQACLDLAFSCLKCEHVHVMRELTAANDLKLSESEKRKQIDDEHELVIKCDPCTDIDARVSALYVAASRLPEAQRRQKIAEASDLGVICDDALAKQLDEPIAKIQQTIKDLKTKAGQ